ncbi:MAG: hypothetical protein WC485_01665 [Opitutaceae bacterium]
MKTTILLAAGLGLGGLAGPPSAAAAEPEIVTAVYSAVANGYARTKQPDGSFKPETYAFGKGSYASGLMRDRSIDNYPFMNLARVLASFLAPRRYVPASSPEQTDLLLLVHWGTTIPYDDGSYRLAIDDMTAAMARSQASAALAAASAGPPGMARPPGSGGAAGGGPAQDEGLSGYLMMMSLQDDLRTRANAHNAALLGYLPTLEQMNDNRRFTALRTYYSDLTSDVEESRYYVIVEAFDFQRAWKQKQLKLLWITRMSIRAQGNRFDQDVAAMIWNASRYFGRDSDGLVRQRVPEGKVEIGEPKVIGIAPAAGK